MEALGSAKTKGVYVYANDFFYIGNGWVFINVNSSDDDIIKFLVGSN